MESGTSKTSVDQLSSNSYDDWQSSDKQETYDGNNDIDNNAVHNSESKETEPEPAGPCPQISDSCLECNADSSYTVTCTVSMVLAVPRGAGSF